MAANIVTRSMLAFCTVLLLLTATAAALWFGAKCIVGNSLAAKSNSRPIEMVQELQSIYELYSLYSRLYSVPPNDQKDLECAADMDNRGLVALRTGKYAIRWGSPVTSGLTKVPAVLGYPITLKMRGGPILYSNGVVATADPVIINQLKLHTN